MQQPLEVKDEGNEVLVDEEDESQAGDLCRRERWLSLEGQSQLGKLFLIPWPLNPTGNSPEQSMAGMQDSQVKPEDRTVESQREERG